MSDKTKILIVDDSKSLRQQVTFTLSKSGFEVVEAIDGIDGIAKVKNNQDLTLIISDINMPNMDGLTMMERLQADGNTVPIIVLTTEGSGELIDRAKAAGAKGWIVKPFKPAQLVGVVGQIIEALKAG